jgi:ketosteroid isomerase-like protein
MSDEQLIRGMLEAWAASVRARDIDGVLRHHSRDLLMFDVVGPLTSRGLDSYRRAWADEFFPWHGGTGRFELRDVDVVAGDRAAFATALIECAGTEDGQPTSFTLRLTVGLEKQHGQWTIVHEHHSEPTPFDRARIG